MIKPMDWGHIGSKVRIYRNLNNGTMSVQAKVGKSWKVVGHVRDAAIRDVVFHVSTAGRSRVIREGRKNVHAWGQGVLVSASAGDIVATVPLGYDPYRDEAFRCKASGAIIQSADWLVVRDNIVFVSDDAIAQPPDEPEQDCSNIIIFPTKPATTSGFLFAA